MDGNVDEKVYVGVEKTKIFKECNDAICNIAPILRTEAWFGD